MRDLKNIEYVLTDAIGQHVLDKYMGYSEATATTATNHDPWFPGCPIFDAINRDPEDGCNFIRFHKDCECLPPSLPACLRQIRWCGIDQFLTAVSSPIQQC